MPPERRVGAQSELWLQAAGVWTELTGTGRADAVVWDRAWRIRRRPGASVVEATTVYQGATRTRVEATLASGAQALTAGLRVALTDGSGNTHQLHSQASGFGLDWQVAVDRRPVADELAISQIAVQTGLRVTCDLFAGAMTDSLAALSSPNRLGSVAISTSGETGSTLTAAGDVEIIPTPFTATIGGLQVMRTILIPRGPITRAGAGGGTDGLLWGAVGNTRRLRWRPRGTGSGLPEHQVDAVIVATLAAAGGEVRRWSIEAGWDGAETVTAQA